MAPESSATIDRMSRYVPDSIAASSTAIAPAASGLPGVPTPCQVKGHAGSTPMVIDLALLLLIGGALALLGSLALLA